MIAAVVDMTATNLRLKSRATYDVETKRTPMTVRERGVLGRRDGACDTS